MSHTEYKDLTIPLNIRVTPRSVKPYGDKWYPAAAEQANAIIIKYLEDAERDGWKPEGVTDFVSLGNADKVREKSKYGLISYDWKYTDFISVTLRMRRIVD